MTPRLESYRAWARRHVVLLVTAAVIFGLISAFIGLADEVAEQETHAIDTAILRGLRTDGGDPIGPVWFEQTVIDLSAIGSGAVVTVVVVLVTIYLLLSGHPRHAAVIVVCALGTSLAVNVLKAGYDRPRPTEVKALVEERGHSFPSGHTFLASALYPTLGAVAAGAAGRRRQQVFIFVAAALLALMVGATRVYIGVHYPTDVAGGWGLGLAWALACGAVSRLLQKEGVVEQPGAT